MRKTRRIRWQLKSLAFGLAAAASFTGTASAHVGTENQGAAKASEIPYLSWGATADDGLPFQSGRNDGPVFMNGVADGYVGSGVESRSENGGVTPTNLARAYVPRFEGVALPDGFQPQLRGDDPIVIRDAPDGAQPQLRRTGDGTEYVTVVDRSFDIRDAALGLTLGLILAAASALALVLGRGRIRVAHS